MAKTSALKTVLAMKPTLSSGSTLNDAYVHYLEQSAGDAGWTMIHEPFEKLIQSLNPGSDATEILKSFESLPKSIDIVLQIVILSLSPNQDTKHWLLR